MRTRLEYRPSEEASDTGDEAAAQINKESKPVGANPFDEEQLEETMSSMAH